MILLFTDTHWDDTPANEYRWQTFNRVHDTISNYPISRVVHCGDAVDRKDRFASVFVNRLLAEIKGIGARVPFQILRGNHDTPLSGPAFFEFINGLVGNVRYITEPTEDGKILLLPFTPDPVEDWKHIRFSDFEAAFMHVTVTGAVSESGFTLTGGKLPIFPRSLKLYSGDVHNPQQVRDLVYVGCPHVIRFGDNFKCRMLLLDEDTFEIAEEIVLPAVRKLVVSISSLEELAALGSTHGDQVRIRFALKNEDVARWGEIEAGIAAWAHAAGVNVTGTEVAVESSRPEGSVEVDTDPTEILRQFAAEEGIADDMLSLGLELLKE